MLDAECIFSPSLLSLFIFTCFNVSFVAFALSKLKIEADLEIWFIGRVRKLVLNINSSWHWVIWKKKKCVLVKTCLFKNDTFKQSKWYDEVRGGRNREEFQFYLWRRRVFEVDIVEKRIKGNGQISRRIIFYFFYCWIQVAFPRRQPISIKDNRTYSVKCFWSRVEK